MTGPARDLEPEVRRLLALSAEVLAYANHADRRYAILDMQYLIRDLWDHARAGRPDEVRLTPDG